MGKKVQSYTTEFRAEAVKLVLAQGLTLQEVSQRISVPKGTLANWVRIPAIVGSDSAGRGHPRKSVHSGHRHFMLRWSRWVNFWYFVSVTMTTQGVPLQIQSVGTLQQPVQHRIGHGRLAQIFVPMIHRELAGNQRGPLVYPVINDFQQVPNILGIHRGKPPIVQ